MPSLYRKLPFDVLNDFEFLGIVNDVPMTVIGPPTLEAKNYAELRECDQQEQGKVNTGPLGPGFCRPPVRPDVPERVSTQMTTVPYKGAAPAITDLMGGTST